MSQKENKKKDVDVVTCPNKDQGNIHSKSTKISLENSIALIGILRFYDQTVSKHILNISLGLVLMFFRPQIFFIFL